MKTAVNKETQEKELIPEFELRYVRILSAQAEVERVRQMTPEQIQRELDAGRAHLTRDDR